MDTMRKASKDGSEDVLAVNFVAISLAKVMYAAAKTQSPKAAQLSDTLQQKGL